MENRPPADAVNRNTIDKVRIAGREVGADGAREKAELVGFDIRETDPSDVRADRTGLVRWRECYRDLWKLKIAFDEKHNGGISIQIQKNYPVGRL